ncbi:MAG: alpha,alpha-trehalase [Clostridia bacterium]|nr:alpha,alpha-trehalase [Clostridia bacterium]
MLKDKISKQLSECVCVEYNDTDTIIGLPYPYSVPTPGNTFRALYYWDTYFTNLGLICTGNIKQAKYNVNDMLYMADRFGFVPNGSRMKYLTRSQPPFLSIMVRDIYEVEKNNEWLEYAYRCLAKEYDFWNKKRTFDDGLSHYGYTPTDGSFEYLYDRWVGRTGVTADVTKLEMAGNYIAQAESGWDFTPRFGIRGQYICCPDLNSLLWQLEKNMAYFSEALENNEAHEWESLSEKRRQKINEVLWDDDRGCFADVDRTDQKAGDIFSVASYYPMFVGLATKEQARVLRDRLSELEHEYGVCPCSLHSEAGRFQWDSPNVWPCLQWIIYKALKNYGYDTDANRIALKYTQLVDRVEKETGQLWEKYNADTGDCDAACEYQTPPMLGWTAGVYLKLMDELK